MNVYEYLSDIIQKATENINKIDPKKIVIEIPNDDKNGDFSTNIAMIMASVLRCNPIEIAKKIKIEIDNINDRYIKNVECKSPGYINFFINESFWHNLIPFILKNKDSYGIRDIGGGERINVEYVSCNPTGPMHAGHARSAMLGDSCANILQNFGYNVEREFYINDAGSQADKLGKSTFLRYKEHKGEKVKIEEGMYPGEYVKDIAKKLHAKYGDNIAEDDAIMYTDFAVSNMMDDIKNDLKMLSINHDVFFSEKSLKDDVKKVLKILEEKGYLYKGVLDAPKGKKLDDWEEKEQLLFKSTQFGDDVDRPMQKSDGSYTYFTFDIAYHYNKYQRGFKKQIVFMGADHKGYVKRMQAAMHALFGDDISLDIKLCNLVKFMENGNAMKMSKRDGTFVSIKDILEKIDKNVLRFLMLSKKENTPFDFDFQKTVENSKDNPVFYLQYAYARIQSVKKQAVEAFKDILKIDPNDIQNEDMRFLNSKDEIKIMRYLSIWPKTLYSAVYTLDPSKIITYLYNLSSMFHAIYTAGKTNSDFRFIDRKSYDITKSRILFIISIESVIKKGLEILHIDFLDHM